MENGLHTFGRKYLRIFLHPVLQLIICHAVKFFIPPLKCNNALLILIFGKTSPYDSRSRMNPYDPHPADVWNRAGRAGKFLKTSFIYDNEIRLVMNFKSKVYTCMSFNFCRFAFDIPDNRRGIVLQ